MARQALAPAGRWLLEEMESGRFAGRKLLTTREVMAAATGVGVPSSITNSISDRQVRDALKVHGARLWRDGSQVRLGPRQIVRVWVLERAGLYDQMSPDQVRDAYEAEAGGPHIRSRCLPALR